LTIQMLSRRGNPVILPLSKKKGWDVLPLATRHIDKDLEVYVVECLLSSLFAVNTTTTNTRTVGPFPITAAVFEFECRFGSFLFDHGLSRDSQSMEHHLRRSPPLPPLPNYSPGGRGSSLPSHGRWRSASQGQNAPPRLFTYSDSGMLMMDPNRPGNFHPDLDLVQQHYCTAYRMEELKTFHCDRVRKMPLSGLDPSMLIGFLCRDEADWWDFRKRVGEVCCAPLLLFFVFIDFPLLASENDIFCTGRTSYMAY